MRTRAFTLVEMIVSLAIFMIVAVVALAALVKIIDANAKAQTIQAAVTSLSFSMDSMSRELRSGSSVYCESSFSGSFDPSAMSGAGNCSSSGQNQLIAFKSSVLDPNSTPPCNLIYAYEFVPNSNGTYSLEKAQQTKDGHNCADTLSSFTSVIPSNVVLTSYQMGMSSSQFPLVFINLSGYAGTKAETQTFFTVQTAASPRTP